tara:strand:+ start:400 stop:627 length:228 start_codon:yes stop_codon:yes gene_type:complete
MMDKELMNTVMEKLNARDEIVGCSGDKEVNFLCGAMEMYRMLNPASEKDGSWCPPTWVIPILSGDSPLKVWRSKQ